MTLGLISKLAAARRAAKSVAGLAPPADEMFLRSNYRGREVDLRGGVATWSGLINAAEGKAVDMAAMAAVSAAGAAGLVDDLAGDGSVRGLKGHLGELRRGRVTTGAVKIAVLGAGALAAAWLMQPPGRPAEVTRRLGRTAQIAVDAALVAGSANLVNLLDLRPGRALKAVALPAALLAARRSDGDQLAAEITGVVLGSAPGDFSERTMLGDTGANALGAAVGVAAVRGLTPFGRLLAATGVAGLIVASERISFSSVIRRRPWLRRIDDWGRQTPDPTPEGGGEAKVTGGIEPPTGAAGAGPAHSADQPSDTGGADRNAELGDG
ncbi:MAG: hypothetical protein LBH68_03760 [Bifidobacteriaceae bacterium]|nr:hypothetical protein [Bifidobacteriaceae bacterium]